MISTLRDMVVASWKRLSNDYQVERLADGTGAQGETAAFRKAARHDPGLRHALESTLDLTRALRELPEVAVPVDFVRNAQRTLAAESKPAEQVKRGWRPLHIAVAFGAGATAATALVVLSLNPAPTAKSVAKPMAQAEAAAPTRWVVTRVTGPSQSTTPLGRAEVRLGDVLTQGELLRVGAEGELRTMLAGTHVALQANTVVRVLDPDADHPALTVDEGVVNVGVAEGNTAVELRFRGRLERIRVRGAAQVTHTSETTQVEAVEGTVEIYTQTKRIELAAGKHWTAPLVISDEITELPTRVPPSAPSRTPSTEPSKPQEGPMGTQWEWDDSPPQ